VERCVLYYIAWELRYKNVLIEMNKFIKSRFNTTDPQRSISGILFSKPSLYSHTEKYINTLRRKPEKQRCHTWDGLNSKCQVIQRKPCL